MVTLLQREFTVGIPPQRAWDHLARVEQWPSWAPHIKKIELQPPGELGPQSTGVIHLTNGMKPVFQMTEFNPPHHWKWVGAFLWLTVIYDHRFEPLDAEHTQLILSSTRRDSAQAFLAGCLPGSIAAIWKGRSRC